MSDAASQIVDRVICDRKTVKVMSEQAQPVTETSTDWNALIETARWAPFHRPAHASHLNGENSLNGIMPWRFYVLNAASCRSLREKLSHRDIGKIGEMLATAELLILATWLPTPSSESTPATWLFEPTLENMEHVAAASAAIENLLISATSHGIPNYWSSGGVLREKEVFELVGIPAREILLGGIFLFPGQPGSQTTTATSKLREQRSPQEAWVKFVEL